MTIHRKSLCEDSDIAQLHGELSKKDAIIAENSRALSDLLKISSENNAILQQLGIQSQILQEEQQRLQDSTDVLASRLTRLEKGDRSVIIELQTSEKMRRALSRLLACGLGATGLFIVVYRKFYL